MCIIKLPQRNASELSEDMFLYNVFYMFDCIRFRSSTTLDYVARIEIGGRDVLRKMFHPLASEARQPTYNDESRLIYLRTANCRIGNIPRSIIYNVNYKSENKTIGTSKWKGAYSTEVIMVYFPVCILYYIYDKYSTGSVDDIKRV